MKKFEKLSRSEMKKVKGGAVLLCPTRCENLCNVDSDCEGIEGTCMLMHCPVSDAECMQKICVA